MKIISFLICIICLIWSLKVYYGNYKRNTHTHKATILFSISVIALIIGISINAPSNNKTTLKAQAHITYTSIDGTSIHNPNNYYPSIQSKDFNNNGHAQFTLHTKKGTHIYMNNAPSHIAKIKANYYHVNFTYNKSKDNGVGYKNEIITKSAHHLLNHINLEVKDNAKEKEQYQQKEQEQRDKQNKAIEKQEKIQAQKQQRFYNEAKLITGKSWQVLKRKYPALNPTTDLIDATYNSLIGSNGINRIHGTVVDISSYDNHTQLLVSIKHLDHLMYIRTGSDNNRDDETRWSHNIHIGDHIVAFGDDFYKNEKITKKMIKKGIKGKYLGKTIYTLDSPEYILNKF